MANHLRIQRKGLPLPAFWHRTPDRRDKDLLFSTQTTSRDVCVSRLSSAIYFLTPLFTADSIVDEILPFPLPPRQLMTGNPFNSPW